MDFFKKFINKRGNMVSDTTFAVSLIFIAIIALPILYVGLKDVFTSIGGDSSYSQLATDTINNFITNLPGTIDFLIIFLVGALLLATIISSFLIDTHPLFLVASLISFFAVLFATVYLANFAEDFLLQFEVIVADLPMALFIAQHLVQIVIIDGVMIAIVLFGKNKILGQ